MEYMEKLTEQVTALLQQRKLGHLREILDNQNPADIALLLEAMPEDKLPLLFRILQKEAAAEAFAYMEGDHPVLQRHRAEGGAGRDVCGRRGGHD